MELYHGSTVIVKNPIYGAGKPYDDFGLGFYCTQDLSLAKEWAAQKKKDGYANEYDLDLTGLTVLDLNSEQYTVLHWFGILLQNRQFELYTSLGIRARKYIIENFPVNYREYDILKGYRADDSYFAYAQNFLLGVLSLKQLNRALHLGGLGEQVVLRSKKAFDQITFVRSSPVDAAVWYPKYKERDDNALAEYRNTVLKSEYRKEDIYVRNILDEEMKPDDPRIQQELPLGRKTESGQDDGLRDK